MKKLTIILFLLISGNAIGQITTALYSNRGAIVPTINSSSYNLNGVTLDSANTVKRGFFTKYQYQLLQDVAAGGGMVYPGAGIPLSTGTAWGTSITNNSANWNTAYGWGNWASNFGYITGKIAQGDDYRLLRSDSLLGKTINQNTSIGYNAGKVSSSTGNSYLGYEAGRFSVGNYNTMAGWGSGLNNNGYYNAFYGVNSGRNNTDNYNSFYGWHSGYTNTTGTQNVFIGSQAGEDNTTGDGNIFNGASSGIQNTTGSYNIFIGRGSGTTNISGINNTYIGTSAGAGDGSGNISLGYNSGASNAKSNRLFIHNSGADSTSAIIYGRLYDNSLRLNGKVGVNKTPVYQLDVAGDVNITTGSNYRINGVAQSFMVYPSAGIPLSTGTAWGTSITNNSANWNTAYTWTSTKGTRVDSLVGKTKNSNTLYGYQVGLGITTGSANVGTGYRAGKQLTTGNYNALYGVGAGYGLTTGYSNTFIGDNSGGLQEGGYKNVALGAFSGFWNNGSNRLYIHNNNTGSEATDSTVSLIYGRFDKATLRFNSKLGLNKTPTASLHLPAGSTAAGTAPLKFTSQASGTTVVEAGAMEMIGNTLQFTNLAVRRSVVQAEAVMTTGLTVANTTTEITVLTIPHGANYLEVGKMEDAFLIGEISSIVGTGANTLTINIYFNGVLINTYTILELARTSVGFHLDFMATCRSIGAGTTSFQSHSSVDLFGEAATPHQNSLTTGLNSTVSEPITIKVQWSDAAAGNSITFQQGRVLCIDNNK